MSDKPLNEIMEFDHVIRVNADGTITDSTERVYAYVVMELWFADDDVDHSTERWELRVDLSDGWELLQGYTGQHGYRGPVMHPSEFIGGGLERHIRETPGHYVALVVESHCDYSEDGCNEDNGCDCEPAGWAIAYKPLED